MSDKLALRTIICVALFSVSFLALASSRDIPKRAPPNWSVSVNLEGVELQIPAAYLSPWPITPSSQSEPRRSIGFAFLMPSGSPSNISPATEWSFWPDAAAESSDYLVKVPSFWVITEETSYTSPVEETKNFIASGGGEANFFFARTSIGLEQYAPKSWPNDTYEYFRNVEGNEIEARFFCKSRPSVGVIEPACDGHIYYPEKRIAFRFRFPRQSLGDWDRIGEIVRRLFVSWSD